jgi:hypothetical protein
MGDGPPEAKVGLPDDSAAYSHLPAGQRLYHLLLEMTAEQILRAQLALEPGDTEEYPVLAELWTDVDELADSMLDEDPEDPVATDYRARWKALDDSHGDPSSRSWELTAAESRVRARTIKRFMLRAGPLSLRRREGQSSRDYWSDDAREFR